MLGRLLLVLTLFAGSAADAAPFALPNDALVITHASRHYQTGPDVIAATRSLATQMRAGGHAVVALSQYDAGQDPDWYGPPPAEVTAWFFSQGGEHPLHPRPDERHDFHVTAIGGYHGACLGWTVSELVARFLDTPGARTLTVTLPAEAIYTGFLRDAEGRLVPATPEDESKADDSIDGLSLAAVTTPLDDDAWAAFMVEMLKWGVFLKHPLWIKDLRAVRFELARDGRVVRRIDGAPRESRRSPRQVVRFDYVVNPS